MPVAVLHAPAPLGRPLALHQLAMLESVDGRGCAEVKLAHSEVAVGKEVMDSEEVHSWKADQAPEGATPPGGPWGRPPGGPCARAEAERRAVVAAMTDFIVRTVVVVMKR